MPELLARKIEHKSATIGIVGLGYVGLPLALTASEAGFHNVIGFDIDQTKIDTLKQGDCYIKHLDSSRVVAANSSGFRATPDFSLVQEVDVLILCVPTPLTKHREPDMRFVRNTLESIKPYIHSEMIISLESTTYPGTTEEEVVPIAEERGLTPE